MALFRMRVFLKPRSSCQRCATRPECRLMNDATTSRVGSSEPSSATSTLDGVPDCRLSANRCQGWLYAHNGGDTVQVGVFPLLPVTSEPPGDPYRILNSPDFDVLGCEYRPGGERYCSTMAPIIQTSAGRQFLITIRIAGLQRSANRLNFRRTSE